MNKPGCRWRAENDMLGGKPLAQNRSHFLMAKDHASNPAAMIIPHRHVETPFDFTAEEWAEIGLMLREAKSQLWTQKRAFSRRCSGGDFAEIYPAVQIEIKPAVGIDVSVDQRRETAIIFRHHTTVPGWFGEYRLQHARVHIDERGLKEV